MRLLATRLTAIASAAKRLMAFSPASLFTSGEQGVWYDPSDMSTLFQDSAGATPVTAVEQPVGLMLDKSKGLVLGSELVTNGDFSAGSTGWTLQGTVTISGGAAVINSSSSTDRLISSTNVLPAGKWCKVTFDVSVISGIVQFIDTAGANLTTFSTSGAKTLYAYSAAGAAIQFFRSGTSFNGTIDNISVKELPGNHATQATASAKPVLSARVNLLTRTEEFDNAAWTKSNVTVTANATTAPNGTTTADLVYPTTSGTDRFVYQVGPSINYKEGIYAKAAGKSWIRLATSTTTTEGAYFDVQNGVVGTVGSQASGAKITPVGSGWYLCSVTVLTGAYHEVFVCDANGSTSVTANGTDGVYIWGADLRVSNDGTGLPAYQRVTTSTDYDTTGFPMYLKFDGVDDSMATGSISFTSTDKMGVFAGVTKTASGAFAVITELSASLSSNNGSFALLGPNGTLPDYGFSSKGTISSEASVNGYESPICNVVSGLCSISEDIATLRINGSQVATSVADQGTGNFGNYPLYIGRRGGSSLPFSGRIYGLVVRGAASDATQISNAETYLNTKTKAY
jgi:hypothetical protein